MKLVQTIAAISTLLVSFNLAAEPINVNSADATTISENLKGIGIKKADAIVQYRTDNGKFSSVEDLENVKGIGAKTIEKNRNDILLSSAAKKK